MTPQKKKDSGHRHTAGKNKYLKDLKEGTSFKLSSGTEGILLKKGVGSVIVYVTSMPKSYYFYNEDGAPDLYWFGRQHWAENTEVEEA